MQPWRTPFPIWNQSGVPCPVLTVASWPAYRFLKRQVRWSGMPISFRIFHSFPYGSLKPLNQTTQFHLIDLHWLLPAPGMKSQALLNMAAKLSCPLGPPTSWPAAVCDLLVLPFFNFLPLKSLPHGPSPPIAENSRTDLSDLSSKCHLLREATPETLI